MSTLKFVFFGTPEFAIPVLDELEAHGERPIAVVCQPDRPKGRGRKLQPPPVKAWAQQRDLPILQPARQRDVAFLDALRHLKPDLALVAAFGQLLTPEVLAIPRLGFINVHPSRIPKYRGAAPMQWTLIRGDRITAVTILRVTPRFDAGDILAQQDEPVDPDETLAELALRLGRIGGSLAAGVMIRFAGGETGGQAQDEAAVVWAPALTKEDGQLDWSRSALDLHNLIRGVQPWPGATTSLRGKRLKVHRAQVSDCPPQDDARPGQVIIAERDRLIVQTGLGTLNLLHLQIEGKAKMGAGAFLAGRQIAAGDVLA